ncbi:unnamed protein product [Dovyalis caffra]|uniref:Uncharacterized protein n=1 Tax=Dovyalis caffra TaxID=77055 RepID=A0AAV1QSG0_9ROSI|nr:unnamed protein product [Dovyalis caffra]
MESALVTIGGNPVGRRRVEIPHFGLALMTLEQQIDCKFQCLEGHFKEIVDRLDALGIDANRNRNDDKQYTEEDASCG